MPVERKNVSSSTTPPLSLVCVRVCVHGRRPDRFPILMYIYIYNIVYTYCLCIVHVWGTRDENYCYYDDRTISNGLHSVRMAATYLQ